MNPRYFKKYGIIQRFVDESDAEFILQLRKDAKLSRFLSKTDPDFNNQIEWIKCYKEREKKKLEYYFITVNEDGERFGVVRLYNIKENFFTAGSWLFKQNAPIHYSILSDIMNREFGFSVIGSDYCHFDVRKSNKSVIKYHNRFNPELIDEDDLNYYFRLSKKNFEINKLKQLKLFGY